MSKRRRQAGGTGGSSQLLVAALLTAGAVVVVNAFLPPVQRYCRVSSSSPPLLPQDQQQQQQPASSPRRPTTQLALWRGWGMGGGGNNATSAAEGKEQELDEMERLAASLLPEIVDDDDDDDEASPSSSSKPPAVLTERPLQQLDDTSSFDGFEGFRGRKVSYSSQPKARSNVVFEIWRQRSPEEIAVLYKGQHQYSASRRVQEAINEQVSTLLGMFLREPDFQSRLQIQGGQLANLFFKLQMLGYMFASADRRLSADSALNKREPPRRPPVGNMTGTVAVSMSEGQNVTMQARDLLGNLVREVEALREELRRANFNREVARQSDLIAYIRALPEEEQLALTEEIPDYTLDCMRKLVDLALARAIPTVGNQWNPSTPVLIPSKAIFAELCIMQVVTGFLLKTTEEDQAQQLKIFGGLGLP